MYGVVTENGQVLKGSNGRIAVMELERAEQLAAHENGKVLNLDFRVGEFSYKNRVLRITEIPADGQ